jgi:DNA mismatch repair protein MutL
MSEEDSKLSLLRHATSKIRTATDIETVMTLGFRGEALPSIASVCAFSLTTSTGEGAGTNVTTDGGGNVTVSPASHSKGTTVLVDRLLFNVPARRAFLKSARAERAAIVETMTNLAIAHPRVMFRLMEKGREVLSLPAAKDLLERLAQLYGVGKARAMQQVAHESGAYRVSGYAALPSVTEASRSRQTVSVNGRWVRAESLTKGIDEAYRATVAAGRYSPVALCVEVDPHQVDVNVHPTKQLVRFSEEKEVRLAISEAVRNAIQGTDEIAPDQDGRTTGPETSDSSLPRASESGIDAPVAAPKSHPAEDHPAGAATSPISPPEDRLQTMRSARTSLIVFSEPPRAPDPTFQRRRPTSQSSAGA